MATLTSRKPEPLTHEPVALEPAVHDQNEELRVYRTATFAGAHETVEGLHEAGLLSDEEYAEMTSLATEPLPAYGPEAIRALRHREDVSQAVFARHLGVTRGAVDLWERGQRTPNGAALVLLRLVERHGLAHLL